MSPLRARMIEHMNLARLALGTQKIGSSSISVQACTAFAGQDTELATLPGLLAKGLRGSHGIGQQLLIQ
jgi:hypothetical protein